jgi:hypothetical protein
MDKKQLKEIIDKHWKWLANEEGGKQANLAKANLARADLSTANLSGANLAMANLSMANLYRTNLSRVNLAMANLAMANLTRANLSTVNLSRANLVGAKLSGSNVRYASSDVKRVKSICVDTWAVVYTKDVMAIGCEQHSIAEWWEFTDSEIDAMHNKALEWWKKWKPILQQIIADYPAE